LKRKGGEMENGSIKESVLAILRDVLLVDSSRTDDELTEKDVDIVKDLEADPIDDISELFFRFGQEFDIEISDKERLDKTRLSQIVGLIEAKLQKFPKFSEQKSSK